MPIVQMAITMASSVQSKSWRSRSFIVESIPPKRCRVVARPAEVDFSVVVLVQVESLTETWPAQVLPARRLQVASLQPAVSFPAATTVRSCLNRLPAPLFHDPQLASSPADSAPSLPVLRHSSCCSKPSLCRARSARKLLRRARRLAPEQPPRFPDSAWARSPQTMRYP